MGDNLNIFIIIKSKMESKTPNVAEDDFKAIEENSMLATCMIHKQLYPLY